jgi:hypothetical protein
MSQRDYIHDKKMRHILSSKKGLETTPSNHEYTIMKQYTLENKGTTKPKWARTVTSDQSRRDIKKVQVYTVGMQ